MSMTSADLDHYRTHKFGDLVAKYPNLHAAVAPSFFGSMRRFRFASTAAFPDGFIHQGYTEPELRLAFAAVMCEDNWKDPMCRQFDRLNDAERALVTASTIFYAGTVPEFIEVPVEGAANPFMRVVGSGYYAEIGS